MDISILTLITIMFFAMMSPGPDMFLLIKNGICYSRRNAILTVVGITTGLLFHMSLAILGLAIVISSNEIIFTVLRYLGAFYLLFIGIQALREKAGEIEFESYTFLNVSAARAYLDGLFCNLLNVKATLFILSVFTQLIDPGLGLMQKFGYAFILLSECIVIWSLFVLVIQTAVIQSWLQRYRVIFSRVFGVLLILLGFTIFLD